jgi:hypothetical protein
VRDGLGEESLRLLDLLKREDRSSSDMERIKTIAAKLLRTLKEERLREAATGGEKSQPETLCETLSFGLLAPRDI